MKRKQKTPHIFSSPNERWCTISNGLTFVRILLTPFIVKAIFARSWREAFLLFVIAGITDLCDGWAARYFGHPSQLGALLDPLADKILLLSSFIAFAFVTAPTVQLPFWFVVAMFSREAVLVSGSTYLVFRHPTQRIEANMWGKATTCCQLLLLLWMLLCYFFSWAPFRTYSLVLVFITLLSFVSCAAYTLTAYRQLRANK